MTGPRVHQPLFGAALIVDPLHHRAEATAATIRGVLMKQPDHAIALDVHAIGHDIVIADAAIEGLVAGINHLTRNGRSHAVVVQASKCRHAQATAAFLSGADAVIREGHPGELLSALQAVAQGLRCLSPAFTVRAVSTDLTPRELEVLQALSDGLAAPEIARALHLSVTTVRTHVVNAAEKLGTRGQTATVSRALRTGLLL